MGRGVVVWAIVDALRVTPDRGQHIFEVRYSRWCRARPMCPRIQLTGGAARFRARRGVRWLGSGSHANNRGKWAKKLNGSKTVDQKASDRLCASLSRVTKAILVIIPTFFDINRVSIVSVK